MKSSYTTYLSLGTNQGNKLDNLQQAINTIAIKIGKVKTIASIYQTPAWGFNGDDFYNTCIEVLTNIKPLILIDKLLDIEKELGRKRDNKIQGYTNRPIDIDILLIGKTCITSEKLTVPHPKMLERKFVLAPLNDIANCTVHPKNNTSINTCLKNCTDTSTITKTNLTLTLPTHFTKRYNYIAIEGNIGAGKTSLSKLLSADFNSKLVLERFAENPFLPKFYKNQERYALALEMSFLADRHNQLSDNITQFDLFKNCIISDYYIFKSLIFAGITLPEQEYNLYRKIFDIMYKDTPKPDLYIYLYQNTDRLLKNIKKRGRDYEQNIEVQYLKKVHNGYINFMKTQQNLNILCIDVTTLDFVTNPEDYYKIIEIINSHH